MGGDSKIEWTEATWNPVVGCTKVSQGCRYCYAKEMHLRLRQMNEGRHDAALCKYSLPFEEVRPWEPDLEKPLAWKRPRLIFVNSMSDLFHEDLPDAYIRRVFDVMVRASQHRFQVLTKRSARLCLAPSLPWPSNVWMGVSVENSAVVGRVDHLRAVPAAVRFLSCEPLLGDLGELDLAGIHWVIAGGESGANARPMSLDWLRSLRDQCQAAGVPFFLKQLGGPSSAKRGGELAVLDGRRWVEMPEPEAWRTA